MTASNTPDGAVALAGAPSGQAALHELFAAHAGATPDAIAVVCGDRQLTYRALDARATALARRLRALGVGPDVRVGVCLPPAADLVTALLAVLKAGGAYLPIDPAYPARRLEFLLADGDVPLLLTHSAISLPRHSARVLPLDQPWPAETAGLPAPRVDALAYVIYTSGSTGRPKGALLTHRGIAGLSLAQQRILGTGPGRRVLQFASASFDASVFEIVMALCSGATLVLPGERLMPGADLIATLDRQAVTTVTLPPSALVVTPAAKLPALVTVSVAGEVCPPEVVRRWAPGRRFHNLYGPTEATVWSTAATCVPDGPVTIGVPVADARAHVLDADLRTVPPGASGELYLGGPGLARGYWRRPGTTADRFVPDPFGEPGARLYRTGDRVLRRLDGELDFVDRLDRQAKVRGHRVEPGEVEAVLREHPAVRDCVVIAAPDTLTAYAVAAETTAEDLRSHCAERLPAHLVPDAFPLLDALPTTPNGKVDRAALPPVRRDSGRPYEEPVTDAEKRLAEIWADVLAVPKAGRHDRFLALGGHSLLATMVQSRVRAAFGVDLPVRAVFEATDLAALAREIAEQDRTHTDAALPSGDSPAPLSSGQRQLWFLEELLPGTAAYVSHVAVRLSGPVSVPEAERALNAVVARHSALRTAIVSDDGQPVQVVSDELCLGIELINAEATPDAGRELAARVARRPFDLGRAPLLRAALVRVADDDHVLVLAGHHAVVDGWSFSLLLRDFATAYRGAPLPPPSARYAQFARWQRDRPELGTRLTYWREQLSDAPALHELPLDRPRPAVQTFAGAVHTFTVPADLHRRLTALSREEEVTLFMTLFTAYAVLLARHSGQDDLVVGTPVANRVRPEFEEVVGFFANTVALRVRIDGDPSFRALLRQVRRTCLAAYAQDVPFELVTDALRPGRDLSHNPVYQVLFALQNASAFDVDLPGVTARQLDLDPGTARFDLAFAVTETDGGLHGVVEYSTDLFAARTVERLADHYCLLLAAMAADPGGRASSVPLLTPAETRQLAEWNDTAAPVKEGQRLHQLIARQAARTPDAIAVVCGDRQLTYAALQRSAHRLAHVLRARGVCAETPVGVFLERSAESIVSLLAVLAAGGAYLPLDPAYPADRLSFMAADSGLRVVVTTSDLAESVPSGVGTVVRLDGHRDEIAAASASAPAVTVGPDHLAYVIYTSGSSGRPKGALMTHRGLTNLVAAEASAIAPSAADRVLAVASFGFDASLWDVVMALCFGGTLCIATGEERLPGPELAGLMGRQAITHATLAPSALASLPATPPDLAVLTSTGEAVTAEVVRRWAPGRQFLNGYGPTECTVGATIGQCRAEDAEPTLGRPFANTQVHLLDARLRPVPPGVAGEVYVSGPGLSRGYLGRPGLTAQRFLPDPFGAPGGRLYRTGDRARFGPDGGLVFLGRADDQVQLRGFRVEPGEIETVLLDHPAVREAAVLVRRGTARLAAYVVAEPRPGTAELREHCARRLPEFMVPAAIVLLDRMPLTSNGKVDRDALPEPDFTASAEYRPPRTAAERALAAVWEQVLGIARVGRDDNFFALGGDSILSIQVVSRAAQAGLAVTAKQLFQHQTVAELAAVAGSAPAVSAEQGPVAGPVSPTPIQQWFLDQKLPAPHHFNQALALRSAQPLDPAALEIALHALLAHHDALRLRLRAEDGWALDNAPLPAEPPALLHIADLTALPAAQRFSALESRVAETQRLLDLASGVLLSALYAIVSEDDHRVLLVAHHLGVDGVSWRILLDDLATAYRQALRREPVVLPPKTTSFRQWAESAGGRSGDQDRCRALLEQHDGSVPVDFAPADFAHAGAGAVGDAHTVTVALDEDQTSVLLRPAGSRSAKDILHTALGRVLTGWTGRDRVLVDVEGHGRDTGPDADLTRTVGWFTVVEPVVLGKDGTEAVGTGCLALRHGSDAPLRSLPVPEVCFNYLGQLDGGLGDAPWELVPELPSGTQDPRQPRPYPLEVTAFVAAGRLHVRWTHVPAMHAERTVTRLAEQFLQHVRDLAEPADESGAEATYPLSPLQQGMRFHALLSPDSGVYVVQLSFALEGDLDVGAFRSAWHQVVSRHPALRTTFHQADGEDPVQVVHREVPEPWRLTDWRGRDDVAALVSDLLERERAAGFDLAEPPLFRFALARVAERTHRFVWTHHHLLMDGWSLPIVLADLFTAYEAQVAGQRPNLPAVPPYEKYVGWLCEQDATESDAGWREALAGFAAPTPLPLEQPGCGPIGTATAEVELSAERTRALRDLCRGNGLTLSTAVQAAWGLVLARHAESDDVVFGVTVAGRPPELPGVESMVGLFINTLPMRLRVDPDAEVAPWLRAVQSSFAEVRQYEHTPLVRIQGCSGVPRGSRLFDSLVVFENYPLGEHAVRPRGGLRAHDVRATEQTDAALTLVAAPGERLALRLMYATDRCPDDSAAALAEQVIRALESFADGPGRLVGSVSLAQEDDRLLRAWNPEPEEVRGPALIERFVEAARTQPDAVALVWGGEQLTYHAVLHRAGGLASRLRAAEVGPDVLVGILLDRGPLQVIAILACHLAGGAYLPLDPAYPQERLDYLLSDSGAPVVVASPDLAARVPAGPRVLTPEAAPAEPAPAPIDSAHLAYVIYTSGSTGRPKGVLVPHGNAARLFDATRHWFGFGREDVWSLFHSVSFDFSVWELWGALAHGGRLVLVDDTTRRAPADFARVLADQAVTVLNQTPSAFLPLAETVSELPALRTVVFGGEALSADRLAGWAERFGLERPQLVNMYGITETTVHVTRHPVGRPDLDRASGSVVGRPIPDLRVYLLDDDLRPVPAGIAGHLHVGGAGPARGYLGRPGLTAERFVPDPFGEPGSRMYRTGDRAHALPDGAFVYLGRSDDQVQLRGHRIEPNEIEAVLRRHPQVTGARVVLREDEPGDQRLVAYLTADGDTSDLRSRVGEALPAHLRPAHYVTLEAFPLTAHGKIDVAALPAPGGGEEPAAGYVAPRTPTEQALAELWCSVLHVPEAGLHDSFFALGGHSLIATRLQGRIRAEFGVELPLRAVFEAPDLAAMAKEIAGARADEASIVPRKRTGPAPLSSAQLRLWFLERWRPGTPLYHIAGVLRLTGELDPRALRTALQAVVDRHESLRTHLTIAGSEAGQLVRDQLAAELPVVDLSGQPHHADRLAAAVAQTPFDLAEGPLWRTVLVRTSPREHQLALCLHHLVADGHSLDLLLRELAENYRTALAGEPIARAPLPIQFADYADWQQDRLAGRQIADDLAYWRAKLTGISPAPLPTDFPRPEVQTHASAMHQAELPAAVAAGAAEVADRTGTTAFMVLFAATAVAFQQARELPEVVVGTPVANRSRPETEELIGCLVNTVVLRADPGGESTFASLLEQVRATCLDAYAHSEAPFERVVQEVQPERSASHLPLFQTWFVVQDEPAAGGFGSLDAQPVGAPPGMARYDLRLEFRRTGTGLSLVCEYKTSLFRPAGIVRLAEHIRRVLRAVTADPGAAIADLADELAAADEEERVAGAAGAAAYSQGALRRRRRAVAAAPDQVEPNARQEAGR
ncbi:non-ribosomal peptide synthetase [Amycolatopsis nivea]|uniref:non-ribosomal peptide synthetase n=1 Tax=Amycolatopsis nivea TaxID=1644109 RepID=UPI00106FB15C|nr:non-ribosomal peptide synthetase [Amycolatopsis nivea]